jgi:hypothetical protein
MPFLFCELGSIGYVDGGMLLKDGRFAFLMRREIGDLPSVIEYMT